MKVKAKALIPRSEFVKCKKNDVAPHLLSFTLHPLAFVTLRCSNASPTITTMITSDAQPRLWRR